MIKGTRHIGFVVRDINKSLQFYAALLGLQIEKRSIEEGNYIDNVVGISGVKLEWAKLKIPGGILLELLQYHSHPDKANHQDYPSNRHGGGHAAFTVSNIDELYNKLISNNIHFNSEPQISPDGKAKVLYCHDPDGIILELVEELNR